MGAVNACWRCGRKVSTPAPSLAAAPSFPATAAPASGGAAEPPTKGALSAADRAALEKHMNDNSVDGTVWEVKGLRHGSPFYGRPYGAAAPAPVYPTGTAAASCALGSLVMAGIAAVAGCLLPLFWWNSPGPLVAVAAAAVGAGLGLCGLQSHRQRMALLGIGLCLVLLIVALLLGYVQLYWMQTGYPPWQAPPAPPIF
ncbi:hypothetical protein Pla8534_47990 [Lignipirellula cremea]|uniref:DUF4190 domain-containing protein n=2 Tax=Lignipirellula cremea TaxID=2528010 RepID=A0A518DYR5_9BACT|nr:hypothetical protein Pla8534_47990 [Lignipirellula cremea]